MKNKNYSIMLPSRARLLLSRSIAVVCFLALSFTSAWAQTITIGTGTSISGTTDNGNPIYRSSATSSFGWAISGHVYTAAQLSSMGAGSSVTSVAFFKTSTGATSAGRTGILNIYMRNSSNTSLSTATTRGTVQGYSLVYTNTAQTIPATTGFISFTLSSPFVYTGGSLEIYMDWQTNGASSGLSTGSFLWQYSTGVAGQSIGTSSSAVLTGATTLSSSQSRSYNLQMNYTAAAPCAGMPNPGNTIASAASVCNGSSVNLTLQNSTTGSGVTYQWQHSDDNSTWTNFGSSSPSASFTMGSITKYFQCIVSCSADPNPGTSNSVQVDVSPFLTCYCASNATNSADTKIDSVLLGTLSKGTAATTCETYTNNTAVPAPVVYFNQAQSIRIRNGSCSGNHYTAYVAVFIDINQDGTYSLAERVASFGPTTALNSIPNQNFTIPSGGPIGLTGMRVILTETTTAITSACGTFTYGETEDYLVDLQDEPVCIDPPTAGNSVSNIVQFCNTGSVNVNLSLNGNSTGSGQTYQWQYSQNGVDYFDISGATTPSYTVTGVSVSTYFQCNVTCGSSTVPSAPVFVEAVAPPVAGLITGPSSGYTNQPINYSSSGENGSLQWQARLLPSGTFSNVTGATNNPQNIFFSSPGSYEVQLVTSVPGCNNATSNAVTTVITVAGDNVCNAIPVNIGVNGPFSNVGATVEVGEVVPPATGCNTNNGWCLLGISNSVWFTFTVPMGGSGRYALGFSPGNWDSQVAIYSATACGDLLTGAATLIAANDDSSGSPYNSYARAHCLTPGQTYYIQVDGYSTTTNAAFGLRIDDLGPANPSFSGLGATVCENAGLVTLTPAVAGGTFSGTGVSGNTFDPALAGAGTHAVTYTLSGLDACYSSTQNVDVVTPTYTYYADLDADTYGNVASSILSCAVSAPGGYSADNTDCDDSNGSINPGASELCNSIDDNCNGLTDEGYDVDNDGYTSCAGDCNDNDNSVYPGATEVCNNVDDDCNLLVDDGLTFITYYADVDVDTYGDASNTVSTCNGAPAGYVSNSTDCNDANAAVNPGATEVCNLLDDDCDGLTDENVITAGAISGPAVQCVSVVTGSATFSISPVFDATGYNWVVPAGMSIVSGQGTNSIFVSWTPIAASNGIIGPLSVTPSNACGNGVSNSVLIDINYTIPVRPSSISGPVKVCPGDAATYSVLGVARASSYVWTLPTGMTITSGAGSNVINVLVDGSYTGGVISCSAANGCGVSPARTRALTVNVPVASASISGPATGVCSATGVTYTAAAVPAATGYNWTVPVGATITGGQGTISITVDFDGTYSGGNITVAATNTCGTGALRSKSVIGAPAVPGVITGDLTICPGQSGVAYGVATVAGASAYTWTVPGGSTITSGQGTKDMLMTWGTNPATGLSVYVNASNACGTSTNRALNGIAIDVLNCVRIGDQGVVTGLNVFPNPATDRATIVFNGTDGADFNLKMVDITGRIVMNEGGTSVDGLNQREFNASGISAGVYFIMIETGSVTEQIRLVIE